MSLCAGVSDCGSSFPLPVTLHMLPRPIIPWGSNNSAFDTHSRNSHFDTVHDFHATISRGAKANPAGELDPLNAVITMRPVLEQPPLLRQYRLAYNTVNGFIMCENAGKVGGVCCSGVPINQIFKHLTQTAIPDSSNCIVHGYRIMPADKQPLEAQTQELYPNAPFMPADLQNVIPHAGQVGPIVGVAPPVPGYICKVCKCGYRSSGTYPHWRDKHRDIARPPGTTIIKAFFDLVPQMQSLSLHNNLIRYFAVTPSEAV